MRTRHNGSNQSDTRDIFPKNGSESFCPWELEVSLNEVVRYAGGSRYQMDSKTETLARSILSQAISLCHPAFGYARHKIINTVKNKGFLIENNIFVPSPPDIPSDSQFLVSVIGTIGQNLEEIVHSLNTKSMYLEALFLDASGVALIESVAQHARERISDLAGRAGLHCGCQWAPGYEKTLLEDQKILFDITDASAIGVQLMQSGVMHPFKSLSFWIPLVLHPVSPVNRNKCRHCSLKCCIYRITHSADQKVSKTGADQIPH